MSFGEAIKSGFRNYCKFDGRARRSEYWFFTLFSFIVSTVLSILNSITSSQGRPGFFYVLLLLFALATFLPSLGLCWRRLHDVGKSGAWFFIGLIPVVGTIILLVWFCKDSQPGVNHYGPNPKGAMLGSDLKE